MNYKEPLYSLNNAKMRAHANVDVIDRYLILSLVSVYVLVPAIFQLSRSPSYHISHEVWVGLVVSCLIAVLMILSRRTRSFDQRLTLSRPVFSTPSLFFLLSITCVIQILNLYIAFASFDASAIRQDLWYSESRDEVIAGRGIIQLFGLLAGPFSLMLLADLFHPLRKKDLASFLFLFTFIVTELGVLIFSSVHRSPLVFTILFWLFFWHFYVRRIKFTFPRFLVASVLTFFYLSWAAYFRGGRTGNVDLLHGMSGLATAQQIETLRNSIQIELLNYELGLQFLYNMISWIPRQLWDTKPITSFSFRVSELIYGDVGVSTWVRTFTVPGEGYLQFGLVGMILATIIFVYLYRLTKIISIQYQVSMPVFLAIWVQFPLIIRGDLSAFFGRFWSAAIAVMIFFVLIKTLPRSGGGR